jgi:hypothetical protein
VEDKPLSGPEKVPSEASSHGSIRKKTRRSRLAETGAVNPTIVAVNPATVFNELNHLRRVLEDLHGQMYSKETDHDRLPRNIILPAYVAVKSTEEAIYKQMSFKEAIATFSHTPLMFLILAVGAYTAKYIRIVSEAFAQGTTFVPPLGLSQQVFTYIVVMIAVLFAFLVCGLFWAGFVAKPKSAAAATVVQHLVTFLSGALLGIKA